MIQDISPKIFRNQYTPPAAGGGYIVFAKGQQVLVRNEGKDIVLPDAGEAAHDHLQTEYLFSIDDTPFYLAQPGLVSERLEAEGYHWQTFSGSGRFTPQWCYFACGVAVHLSRWYDNNRFCGHCGKPLRPKTEERAMRCVHCGNTVYPTISPAVIVGVIHGDMILMTKYADKRDGSRYSLIAGFAEIGEAIEDTVRREVMEEVGVKVKNIRYYKSQPWPFSSSLLLGFFCDLDGDDQIALDGIELSEAEWVHRQDMKIENDNISLTYEMMTYFHVNPGLFA